MSEEIIKRNYLWEIYVPTAFKALDGPMEKYYIAANDLEEAIKVFARSFSATTIVEIRRIGEAYIQ